MSQLQAEMEVHSGLHDAVTLLREAQRVVSAVYHDANNPLSIIAGNAQYLAEIAKMQELDEEIVQPLQDIDEACQRVAEELRELRRLRERIATYLDQQRA